MSARVPITAAASLTSLGAPACESAEPAYVLIESTGVAALPAMAFREVSLRDGETVRVFDESCKVNETHYASMATVRGGQGDFVINNGFGAAQWPFSHIYFRGLHFQTSDIQTGPSVGLAPTVFNFNGTGLGGLQWTLYPTNASQLGDHLIFNQCAVEADPNNTGLYGSKVSGLGTQGFGWVNSFISKIEGVGSGDGG